MDIRNRLLASTELSEGHERLVASVGPEHGLPLGATSVARPVGRVVVALGPVRRAEHLDFLLGALSAVRPDLVVPPSAAATALSGPAAMRCDLTTTGRPRELRFATTTWKVAVRSVDDLLDQVGNVPGLAAVRDRMTAWDRRQVRHVLDGMLRERSGGTPGAVLDVDVRIASAMTT